jgi:hypothetical protein
MGGLAAWGRWPRGPEVGQLAANRGRAAATKVIFFFLLRADFCAFINIRVAFKLKKVILFSVFFIKCCIYK